MSIDILLATYNGEKFLKPLLDSLLAQTTQDWKLLVRDDGSSDATVSIIAEYQARTHERIHIVSDGRTRLGAAKNFAALLEASTAEYIMFCDQDDVWMEDKIACSLAAMRELETTRGKDVPLLVHTDAVIVDEQMRPLSPSFAKHHRSQPTRANFARMLVQNMVHGCTLMANRKLVDEALPVPDEARMHDMWLALVASSLGAISYIPQPTLYYRQHESNVIGARKFDVMNIRSKTRQVMEDNVAQALAFHARYWGDLGGYNKEVLDAFVQLPQEACCKRRWVLLNYGCLRRPLWQNIPALLFA